MNASEKTFGSPTVSQSTTGLCLKQMCENLWNYQSANLIRAQSTKRWRCQIALKPNRTVFICLDGKFRLQPAEFRKAALDRSYLSASLIVNLGPMRKFPRLHHFSQIGRTKPSFVARVLRTSSSTRSIPTNGTRPATTIILSKECPGSACVASENYPINSNAMIVPIPAPVPLKPLTEATEPPVNRSEGNTLAIVENAA